MTGYATPELAVRADDSVPPQYVRIVAVDHSPDGKHAAVLIEYNEPPMLEPYAVLCEQTPLGWLAGQGGSAGGLSWMATDADAGLGVEIAWGRPPTVRWGVPARGEPKLPPGVGRW